VVAEHAVPALAADQEVAVEVEGETGRAVQPPAPGRNKLLQEDVSLRFRSVRIFGVFRVFTVLLGKDTAEDGVGGEVGDVEVPVEPELHVARLGKAVGGNER